MKYFYIVYQYQNNDGGHGTSSSFITIDSGIKDISAIRDFFKGKYEHDEVIVTYIHELTEEEYMASQETRKKREE